MSVVHVLSAVSVVAAVVMSAMVRVVVSVLLVSHVVMSIITKSRLQRILMILWTITMM